MRPRSVPAYSYGTTNNQLVDISPSGSICAGTWNRNTGGGIADYTYCNYSQSLAVHQRLALRRRLYHCHCRFRHLQPRRGLHPRASSSISLVTTSLSSSSPQQCFSQNQQAQLDAQACYAATARNTNSARRPPYPRQLCLPGCSGAGVTSVPSCGSSIGTLNFSVGNSSVATINATTNVITAEQPGTTAITATIAQSSSSAGYFSTCPPASINVSLANGGTKGVVTQGVSQNLTTTVTDTQGNTITGLALDYQSTNPIDITATGAAAPSLPLSPASASVNAVCEPPPAIPLRSTRFGLNGTGLSVSSNPVNIIVPGTTSDFVWFGAPGQSQYFAPSSCSPAPPAPPCACLMCPTPWSWTRTETTSTSARPAS